MLLTDLPQEIQDNLKEERLQLKDKWRENSHKTISFTNEEGTRYFYAYRYYPAGRTRRKGEKTHWVIRYGKILWDSAKQVMGNDRDYFWVRSSKVFGKSSNGTIIPRTVDTKKEVLEIAKSIGTLIID